MATIKTVAIDDVARALEQDPGVHVWNVLDDEWFKGELIPGSRRVPVSGLADAVQQSSLPKDAPVIVYCAGEFCPSSRQAAEQLTALGYSNVAAFEGGVDAWKQAGRATALSNGAPAAAAHATLAETAGSTPAPTAAAAAMAAAAATTLDATTT